MSHGRQRRRAAASRSRCCAWTTCCTRSRWATTWARTTAASPRIAETEVALREIVQDAAGEWIERHRKPAAAGEGAMSQARNSEEKRIMQKWRAGLAALVFGCACRWPPGRRTRSSRSPAPSRPAPRSCASSCSEPLAARAAAASRSRRRRASRSTCRASATLSAATRVDINQGNLRSVSVAQAGERTRLVLNLKQAASYRAQLHGKALVLVLEQRPRRGGRQRRRRAGAVRAGAERAAAGAARHRLPPRHRRRRPRRRRPAQHPGRVSTSASRARAWWSSSCARRCPSSCAAAST